MSENMMARALAAGSDEEQAEFLNVFAETLSCLCRRSATGGLSMQTYMIAKLLRGEAVAVLRDIVEAHKYLTEEVDKTRLQINERRAELERIESAIRARQDAEEAR